MFKQFFTRIIQCFILALFSRFLKESGVCAAVLRHVLFCYGARFSRLMESTCGSFASINVNFTHCHTHNLNVLSFP